MLRQLSCVGLVRLYNCIKESQDSDNGDEKPRQKEHYSHTGGNGPSFTPPTQRCRYTTKKAEGDNDDVDDIDERFHGRYLHPIGEQVNIAGQ